ncbi:hypothetical protein [Streptobacillus canis]|uniref:hypothetical protein n=1 Tax=Streptobacillus canis TaxID=2678686 RepID=UPI0012E26422|nr:hypothetical protein [Streptobacillus canis]
MGGRVWFATLKEDIVEGIKKIEDKVGGLKYIKTGFNNYEIYNSIDEIPELDNKEKSDDTLMYFIVPAIEEFVITERIIRTGKVLYKLDDEKNALILYLGGKLKDKKVVLISELNTNTDRKDRMELFKQLKKVILKNTKIIEKRGYFHVGKSVIERKDEYQVCESYYAEDRKICFDISHLTLDGK